MICIFEPVNRLIVNDFSGLDMSLVSSLVIFTLIFSRLRYGDSVDNTAEENASIFSLVLVAIGKGMRSVL